MFSLPPVVGKKIISARVCSFMYAVCRLISIHPLYTRASNGVSSFMAAYGAGMWAVILATLLAGYSALRTQHTGRLFELCLHLSVSWY